MQISFVCHLDDNNLQPFPSSSLIADKALDYAITFQEMFPAPINIRSRK